MEIKRNSVTNVLTVELEIREVRDIYEVLAGYVDLMDPQSVIQFMMGLKTQLRDHS